MNTQTKTENRLCWRENWTVVEMEEGTIPNCDFCENIAEYDAEVKGTPENEPFDLDKLGTRSDEAFFCEEHFASESNQKLGLGHGQRIVQVPFVIDSLR